MIPLVDDCIQLMLANSILWMKKHPGVIDLVFQTATRQNATKLKKYLSERKFSITLGYPRVETALPAFVIALAPENETPMGIGDMEGTFDSFYLGESVLAEPPQGPSLSEEEEFAKQAAEDILRTYMRVCDINATYRIECWADNADLTAFMYAICKWSMLTYRKVMFDMHWKNIMISGADMEPIVDYMPQTVFRRALQVSMSYENLYYTDIGALGRVIDVLEKPGDFDTDPKTGDVKDPATGEVIIPGFDTWVLDPHYYSETLNAWQI